ncbi:MAG: 4-hydroxy-tetrahydrodipicolinate synthase [Alphaproteobacteria bacterium]|nr:4-hydroxy-tetrahydrodipicolinate synthase [Alphaproteobacteria bacterium]
MFQGSIVALVTPFQKGKIDEKSLQNLVSWHCNEGTQGIVVGGSTGEGNLLNQQERNHIFSIIKETANKRIPIIVSCGSPSTEEAVHMALEAKRLGADGILATTPFYVKPSQLGLYQHFSQINKSVDIPMIIYSNPGRAVVEVSVDLLLKLSELENVVGLKDSTDDMSRPSVMRSRLKKKISLLCGDDPFTSAYLAQGGDGSISVAGNVVPKLCRQLIDAWRGKNMIDFVTLTQKMTELCQSLFLETNPCPVKYALSAMGKIQNELRLPLLPIASSTEEKVNKALKGLGVI